LHFNDIATFYYGHPCWTFACKPRYSSIFLALPGQKKLWEAATAQHIDLGDHIDHIVRDAVDDLNPVQVPA
jgi:hypothetical protein